MSWEDLRGEVEALFAELSAVPFDALIVEVDAREQVRRAMSREACKAASRIRYATDAAYAEKKRGYGRAWIVAHPERVKVLGRERYVRLRAAGVCTNCGARPAMAGQVRCAECRNRQRATAALRRREAGMVARPPYQCSACGDVGHNKRTCAARRVAA